MDSLLYHHFSSLFVDVLCVSRWRLHSISSRFVSPRSLGGALKTGEIPLIVYFVAWCISLFARSLLQTRLKLCWGFGTVKKKEANFSCDLLCNNKQLLYMELTVSFLIGWKRTVSFQNQLAADYTIMMSWTLKVTDNYVMCDRGALFVGVIMSRVAHFALLYCQWKRKNMTSIFFVLCRIKQLLDEVVVISRITKDE